MVFGQCGLYQVTPPYALFYTIVHKITTKYVVIKILTAILYQSFVQQYIINRERYLKDFLLTTESLQLIELGTISYVRYSRTWVQRHRRFADETP